MRSQLRTLIETSLHEINESPHVPGTFDLSTFSDDTVLYGDLLSSLGLVEMLLLLEEAIANEFSVQLTIADEKAMSLTRSPFKTVGRLLDFLEQRLSEDICGQ
jgi:acyl carrier protein